MAQKKDYYKILGVGKDATESDLKSAYKKGALKYHPDRQHGKSDKEIKEAEEKFKELNEAYTVLSDPDKRRQYDTFGTADGMGDGMDIPPDMAEMMRNMGFGFGNFGGFGGPTVMKGRDIRADVQIPLADLLKGGETTFTYIRNAHCEACNGTGSSDGKQHRCPTCNGTGRIVNTIRRGFSVMQNITVCQKCGGTGFSAVNPCSTCGGEGVRPVSEVCTIGIPNGATDGTYMIMEGKGDDPKHGGVPGDLAVYFRIICPESFMVSKSDPYNVHCDLSVPVLDCLTGGETIFNHVDGRRLKFPIPECMEDGHTVKLRGEGIRRPDGSRGDVIVTMHHKMPKSINTADKKAVEKLKNLKSFGE